MSVSRHQKVLFQEARPAYEHDMPYHALSGSLMQDCMCVDIWDHTLHTNAAMDQDPTPAEIAAVTRMSIAELRQSLAAITALHQVCSFSQPVSLPIQEYRL